MIGAGAAWIWNLAQQYFPGAIQIVDLDHARQRWWALARKLYPHQDAEQRRWMMIHQDMLEEGKIENLVSAVNSMAGLRTTGKRAGLDFHFYVAHPNTSRAPPRLCRTPLFARQVAFFASWQ